VRSQAGPAITALITCAANASPLAMFCGFSSSALPYSGSTMQKPGRVPAAASVKNPAIGTIFVPWFFR